MLNKEQEECLSEDAFIFSLHIEQNVDSSDEEIQDEDAACGTISDLDVIVIYKIRMDLQEQFD